MGEIHKHKHNFEKKHSMTGRIKPVVHIEPLSLQTRHDLLAEEMLARGMNHNSPFEQPDVSYLNDDERYALVDREVSKKELCSRCEDCKKRIMRGVKQWD